MIWAAAADASDTTISSAESAFGAPARALRPGMVTLRCDGCFCGVVAADPRRRMLRGSLAGRKEGPAGVRVLPGDCRGELAADRSRAPVGGESAASAAPGEVSYGDADSSVRQDHRKSAAGVARYT